LPTFWKHQKYITTWKQFNSIVRSKEAKLLHRLSDFPNCVLVSGCQRSGTTMLSRIITESDGMVRYWFGPDDELDAALILSGYVGHSPEGRYCFQTTYLNKHFNEYYDHKTNFTLIWMIRNPNSVIYSLLNNFSDFALNYLYKSFGRQVATRMDNFMYSIFGIKGIPKIRRACHIYVGKSSQIFNLRKNLSPEKLIVVEYDDLSENKIVVLPELYQQVNLSFKRNYLDKIHAKSLIKHKSLTFRELKTIKKLCFPVYLKAKELVTIRSNNFH